MGLHITFSVLLGALLSSISKRRQWTEALGRDLASVTDIPRNMLEGVSSYGRLIRRGVENPVSEHMKPETRTSLLGHL